MLKKKTTFAKPRNIVKQKKRWDLPEPLRGPSGLQRRSVVGVTSAAQCMPGHRTERWPASLALAELEKENKS